MTTLNFYHLTSGNQELAACQLLEKCYKSDYRVVVKACNEEVQESLNRSLWTFAQKSFIPHGSKADTFPEEQPIYITTSAENPNDANVLMLLGTFEGVYENYEKIFVIFDGSNESAFSQAKNIMFKMKDGTNQVTYYQQTKTGWQNVVIE